MAGPRKRKSATGDPTRRDEKPKREGGKRKERGSRWLMRKNRRGRKIDGSFPAMVKVRVTSSRKLD